MGFNRLYFKSERDEKKFLSSEQNYLYGKTEKIQCDVGRAMESFSKIETGLATLIARALIIDQSNITRIEFKKLISQYFGMHHMVRIIRALIKLGAIEYWEETTILRPGLPEQEVGYVEAIEFASKFRNAMVHNGVQTGIRFEKDECIAEGIIIAEGEDYVPILSTGYEFGIFLGRLALFLPPAPMQPVFKINPNEIDVQKFLLDRGEKWKESQMKFVDKNTTKIIELAKLFS